MKGWVAIPRTLFEHQKMRDADVRAIVLEIYQRACIQQSKVSFRGKGFVLQRGQLLTSSARLARSTGASPTKARRTIEWLTDDGHIKRQADNRSTIITINYDFFESTNNQTSDQQPDQQTTSNPTSKRPHYNKGELEERKMEKGTAAAAEEPLPPPLAFPNPQAIPSDIEQKVGVVQADIDTRRAGRGLAAIVGHMATSPIDSALREPGVTPEHLLDVVAFEFAKYDAAQNKADVITHLTPHNLFNSHHLSDAIDRAGRFVADPEAWNFAAGNGVDDRLRAELKAELKEFNKYYG